MAYAIYWYPYLHPVAPGRIWKWGGTCPARKWGWGHRCGAKCRTKNFLLVLLHFLVLKVQLVALVSAFVMVSTVWPVSCLLFFSSRCPPCPIWSRRHCLHFCYRRWTMHRTYERWNPTSHTISLPYYPPKCLKETELSRERVMLLTFYLQITVEIVKIFNFRPKIGGLYSLQVNYSGA